MWRALHLVHELNMRYESNAGHSGLWAGASPLFTYSAAVLVTNHGFFPDAGVSVGIGPRRSSA